MKIFFEILKVMLPAITTGLFTFLITKYTYNKNRPLDKMETAYNRIYYPIYKIISDKNINKDINKVIDKSKIYILKNSKYIDTSTQRIFDSLCKCNKNAMKKAIYKNFKGNILEKNAFLRRKLGYLEPDFFQLYKYLSPSDKTGIRIALEFCVTNIAFIFSYIIIDYFKYDINQVEGIVAIPFILLILSIILIVGELLYALMRCIYYKIRK